MDKERMVTYPLALLKLPSLTLHHVCHAQVFDLLRGWQLQTTKHCQHCTVDSAAETGIVDEMDDVFRCQRCGDMHCEEKTCSALLASGISRTLHWKVRTVSPVAGARKGWQF